MVPTAGGSGGNMVAKKKATPTVVPLRPDNPWWKSTWLKITAGVAAVAVLLGNINSILASSRALPGELGKTADQFSEWYGDYDGWKGHWTTNGEGYVDAAEMRLSSEKFELRIDEVKDGEIAGTIETQGICEKTSMFDQLMVEGQILSSRSADIVVFEIIEGHKRPFAILDLRRNGDVLTIDPVDDPAKIFVPNTRVARDLNVFDDPDAGLTICPQKREEFIKGAVEEAIKQQRSSGKATK